MIRLLFFLLLLWSIPLAAQRDTMRNGQSRKTVYWPNGHIKEEGNQGEYGPIGKWNYYDSLGRLVRREWYSYEENKSSEWYDGVSHLDSVHYYWPQGGLASISINARYTYVCRNAEHPRTKMKGWKYVREEREYYGNGQLKRKTTSVERPCDHYDSSRDTFETHWYATGQLAEAALNNGMYYRFYSNGALKSYRSNYFPNPRDGEFLEMDSTGKVLFHRMYVKGKLTAILDSSGNATEEERTQMAHTTAGIAAASLFSRSYVTGGDQQQLRYYTSELPVWRESATIPDSVIDSLSYAWAGALLVMPQHAQFNRDTLLNVSNQFHPAKNEWYYTLVYTVNDYAAWLDSCRKGKLYAQNAAADSFFHGIGYHIVSFKGGTPSGQTREATVVIRTGAPINFIAFHKALAATVSPVTIYCGRVADPRPEHTFQAMRASGTYYIRLGVLLDSPHSMRKGLFFTVNSDQTADYSVLGYNDYGFGIRIVENW